MIACDKGCRLNKEAREEYDNSLQQVHATTQGNSFCDCSVLALWCILLSRRWSTAWVIIHQACWKAFLKTSWVIKIKFTPVLRSLINIPEFVNIFADSSFFLEIAQYY
jgi:hypothetical protein